MSVEPAAPPDAARMGLSDQQAAQRLQADGPNAYEPPSRHGLLSIVADVAGDPMFLLLFAAGGVYLLLGDPAEAGLLMGFVVLIVIITVAQARRTSRVLDSLKAYSRPQVTVWRSGQLRALPSAELVVGDEVMLTEGERVPADGLLLEAHELAVDESALTGESVVVRKVAVADELVAAAQADDGVRPGGDDQPHAWAGTLIVQGQGVLRVTATGIRTEFGAIGRALAQTEAPPSPLQLEMRRAVRRFAALGLSLSVVVTMLYGVTRGDWLGALLAGIALAMSLLPQEFPVILTVFLALGARRLAERGVLVHRLPAIEMLGETTVLCVDKTGTLTENRMRVAALVTRDGAAWFDAARDGAPDKASDVPVEALELLGCAVLASEVSPSDPMEQAIHRLAGDQPGAAAEAREGWAIEHEYALSPELLAMTHGWRRPDAAAFELAAKGAPEAIADLCHLDEAQCCRIREQAVELAARGLRVLGVARGRHAGADWPAVQHDLDYEYLGLVGLADPLRAEVPQAVAACHAAGVRVVMITGDYPVTAQAIAAQAGIPAARVLSGAEVAKLDEAQLAAAVASTDIFARVTPQQKLCLVQAFVKAGEVVAMTGDGVNDAPALAAAHIGVAMARRGSEPAREAAALLLLHDNFAALVEAIALGRRVYDNLARAMRYTVAVHLPIAGLTLAPLLLGLIGPIPAAILFPVHVAFLEMVIDPTCSIVFEAEPAAHGLMHRRPRRAGRNLFDAGMLKTAIGQGLLALGAALMAWYLAHRAGLGAETGRALCFATLVLSNLGLVIANRDRLRGLAAMGNRQLVWVSAATLVALGAVLGWPVLARMFGFALPTWGWLCAAAALAAAAGLASRSLVPADDGD